MGRKNIFFVGKSEENRPLEDLAVDERVTLKCMFQKKDTGHKID